MEIQNKNKTSSKTSPTVEQMEPFYFQKFGCHFILLITFVVVVIAAIDSQSPKVQAVEETLVILHQSIPGFF